MIAVGGWGDTLGFSEASRTDAAMQKFATDINTMITNTGCDGVGKINRLTLVREGLVEHLAN